ncbi:YeeE/YedE thiosulfate transporter family protein [Sulfitobacter sp.]|uniref:YeeE/YedE family protein n=1 Tax=Sulfitobacter sp. TaxID=1903071 RepID=UPI00329A3262
MPMEWIWGLIGGLLIGSGGALYLLGNGRIMGASGILGNLLDGSARIDTAERLAFLVATVALPAILFATGVHGETNVTNNIVLLIAAGLLVGLGTRIGNGCTSGHGVCGISRLSIRGMVATAFYIGAGILSVAAMRVLL